jgi:hypothetical protein
MQDDNRDNNIKTMIEYTRSMSWEWYLVPLGANHKLSPTRAPKHGEAETADLVDNWPNIRFQEIPTVVSFSHCEIVAMLAEQKQRVSSD